MLEAIFTAVVKKREVNGKPIYKSFIFNHHLNWTSYGGVEIEPGASKAIMLTHR